MSTRSIKAQRQLVQAMKHGDIDIYRLCGHGTKFPDEEAEDEAEIEETLVPSCFSALPLTTTSKDF
jgi:hypothetical protein